MAMKIQLILYTYMLITTAAIVAIFALPATLGALQLDQISVWDGVYSEKQAARGKEIYRKECETCHLSDLTGNDLTPALTGIAFEYRWGQLSIGDIFSIIRITMPQSAPDSLSSQEYIDTVSYLLQMNGFPVGKNELTTKESVLNKIIILPEKP